MRRQVEAARLPEGEARVALEDRARHLLGEHGPDWLTGTGLPPSVVQFHRWFPDELDFSAEDWEEEPEDGWDAVPEEGLLATLLTALRGWSELGCVRRLVLCSEEGMGAEVVGALVDAPEYRRVTQLVFVHQMLGPRSIERLAASKVLTRLRVLSIPVSSNNDTDHVRDAGCAAIAGSPNFARLEVLELSRTEIGDVGAAALAGSPHLANLRRLDLSFNKVGDVGASALAASPHLRALEKLTFQGNRASAAALRVLEARYGDLSIPDEDE